MSERIRLAENLQEPFTHLLAMHGAIEKRADEVGLDRRVLELVKIRASQINGCAFCLDMHIRGARTLGESDRRIDLLATWWETDLYTEQERAALELAEAITRLSETASVAEDAYQRATKVFTDDQYAVVAWAATVINTFNRVNVTGPKPLPDAGS